MKNDKDANNQPKTKHEITKVKKKKPPMHKF